MNKQQLAQYQEWLRGERSKPKNAISKHRAIAALTRDLLFVSKMEVEEYTLYRKWLEVNNDRNALNHRTLVTDDSVRVVNGRRGRWLTGWGGSDLSLGTIRSFVELEAIRNSVWTPPRTSEAAVLRSIMRISPEVTLCRDEKSLGRFADILRTFGSTGVNNGNVGRNLHFIVSDRRSNKVYGVLTISSDFLDLRGRDEYIGWSREVRTRKPHTMLNHTAIGSTIVPTQPFGYNFAGGKLIALMTMSDVVENAWNEHYDTARLPSRLVGVTTTSLYGASAKNRGSQYSNLSPYWAELGETAGETSYEPTPETLKLVREYLRQEYPLKYWQWVLGKNENNQPMLTNAKQRSLSWLYRELGIDSSIQKTNHQRGTYFAHFYENFREFLRMEIPEDKLVRRMDITNDVESLTEYWKEKHAIGRFKVLGKKGRLDFDMRLFYHDLATLTWDKTKQKYLFRVGKMSQKTPRSKPIPSSSPYHNLSVVSSVTSHHPDFSRVIRWVAKKVGTTSD